MSRQLLISSPDTDLHHPASSSSASLHKHRITSTARWRWEGSSGGHMVQAPAHPHSKKFNHWISSKTFLEAGLLRARVHHEIYMYMCIHACSCLCMHVCVYGLVFVELLAEAHESSLGKQFAGTFFWNVCFSFSLVSNMLSVSVKQEANIELSQITSVPQAISKANIGLPMKNTTITHYWTYPVTAWPPSCTVNESTHF